MFDCNILPQFLLEILGLEVLLVQDAYIGNLQLKISDLKYLYIFQGKNVKNRYSHYIFMDIIKSI